MTRLDWGLAVWVPAFFALELPAHFWNACPWPTLSGTVWVAVKDWHPVAYFVAAALALLYLHFDWHWSAGWLIALAAVLAAAVAVHLLAR